MSLATPAPHALSCAVFLVAAMSLAGIAHAMWLRSRTAQSFHAPVDFNLRVRGRPLFGANKMWRGFVVMPLGGALAFWAFAMLRGTDALPAWLAAGMWELPPMSYAWLGFACGLAFMLAELPNSFVKRQLDIAPGMAPERGGLATACFVIDRIDSVLGVLIVVTLLLPVSAATWGWVLVLGPGVHGAFSVWLHRLGVKARPL
jgi:CDP-2,3-bis-(O-geranylgeranyl)-sn-glycerol synthase